MTTMLRNLSLTGVFAAVVVLAACGNSQAALPAFPASAPWYNTTRALTWKDLQGRAVLLDFFTPGCINCVHMIPVEDALAQRFGKQLVIIGVDAPKFTDSGTVSGLKDFITVHHVHHPVVLDTHLTIWTTWHAVAWPTLVLVGPHGKPQQRFIGEQSVSDLAGPIAAALANAPPADTLKSLPFKSMGMSKGVLDSPGGIAVSGKRVAISDTGHNRVVLARPNGKVTAVIGAGCAGTGDDKYTDAKLSRPHGLAFHDGKLYVADTKSQKIRVINLKTHAVTTLAGSGKRALVNKGLFAAADATLNSPWDLAWIDNRLYVSMAGDHAIWRYDPDSGKTGPWAGSGREGLRDGHLATAEFAQPSGLDAHNGILYDADPESSSLRRIDPTKGQVKTLLGHGLFSFGFKDGPADKALLQHDQGLLWYNHSIYIADTFNDALRRLDLQTNSVTTVARDMSHPTAIAALASGKLLVTESGANRVVSVDPAIGQVSAWPLKGLQPGGCHAH